MRRTMMRFKQFEIRKPTFIGDGPGEEYFKYNFDLVKWADDNSYCWSIGHLEYNRKESCFEFRSVGSRYFECREPGLEEWVMKWCELKEIEYEYEENEK
jgi:hypothetical protein